MRILLGWSKERSRRTALLLKELLPGVLPGIDPWMSELDIRKGKDWSQKLHETLGNAGGVIVCFTKENLTSPWLYYECGFIAALGDEHLVCPYLLDDVQSLLNAGPLHRFQGTRAEKEDTLRMFRSFNTELGESACEESLLDDRFAEAWELFEPKLGEIRKLAVPQNGGGQLVAEPDAAADIMASPEAILILSETSKDVGGKLNVIPTPNDRTAFITNGRCLLENSDAKTTALWFSALRKLINSGLMVELNDQWYRVTHEGHVFAASLPVGASAPTKESPATRLAEANRIAGVALTPEARTMLLAMGRQKPYAALNKLIGSTTTKYLVDAVDLDTEHTPRSQAKWEAAFRLLGEAGLIEGWGALNRVNAKGFSVIDALGESWNEGESTTHEKSSSI